MRIGQVIRLGNDINISETHCISREGNIQQISISK